MNELEEREKIYQEIKDISNTNGFSPLKKIFNYKAIHGSLPPTKDIVGFLPLLQEKSLDSMYAYRDHLKAELEDINKLIRKSEDWWIGDFS